jgi:uroporphyrinogen decarboxylase
METLSHRERLLLALNLDEPDRVPLDLGSSIASTIVVPAYDNLKTYLGLAHDTRFMTKRARTAMPNETILQRFDIDTRPLMLSEYRGGRVKEIDANTIMDAWGVIWKKAPDGHFINAEGPFQKEDPRLEGLETFDWPDPDNPGLYDGLRERAAALRENTDYAIVLNLNVGVVHLCQFIRGFAEWLMDLYENPDFAAA